jgi:hypothetical protein
LGVKGIEPEQRIFSITDNVARAMVSEAGKQAGVKLRPHDLKWHAATHASGSGTQIGIVSKEIFAMLIYQRHSDI